MPVQIQHNSDGLRLNFAFDAATPAALFRRADAVWLLFDSTQGVDLDAIRRDAKSVVGEVSRIALPDGQAIRMRLIRPQLVALADTDGVTPSTGGRRWTLTFADTLKTASEPLEARRNVADPRRATITIPLEGAGKLHRLTDPDAGDTLLVVTAKPPARGFIKRQDMVELSVLESVQGVVVRPKSDDITATVSPDSVTLTRPGGLTLSSARMQPERATASVRPLFDDAVWRDDRAAAFASVRAMTRVGVPQTSAARRAAVSFSTASRVGTSTVPPMWPHFLTEASWSSKCTPAAPASIMDFISSKAFSTPPKPASALATMGAK